MIMIARAVVVATIKYHSYGPVAMLLLLLNALHTVRATGHLLGTLGTVSTTISDAPSHSLLVLPVLSVFLRSLN